MSKVTDNDDCQTTKPFFITWCPSTEAVGMFSLSWSHNNNFVVPLLSLVCNVVKQMEKLQARGTLVVIY